MESFLYRFFGIVIVINYKQYLLDLTLSLPKARRLTLNLFVYKNIHLFFCLFLVCLSSLINSKTFAQYTINGSATKDNCHCYTLTTEDYYKSASVWNNTKIDLRQSFTFTFDVYLGCLDQDGADGLVFALQQVSNKVIGANGNGLGFQGIFPSVGVTLDTYRNLSDSDPIYDHLSIQVNGDVDHKTANTIAGPIPISAVSDNVEDCNWHSLTISWNATIKKYDISFDGASRLSIIKDLVTDIFNGNPIVYWGITSGTGGFINVQKFCLPLSAYFKLPPQRRCIGDVIQFLDSSRSGSTIKRYWNFGDGSNIDSTTINPVHTYLAGGDYQVTLNVKGFDECTELYAQTIRIGNKPVANFNVKNSCQQSTVLLDSSYANFGTLNNWYWTFGNGTISTVQNPVTTYLTPGIKTISLAVKSLEGCTSDTTYKNIIVDPQPFPLMSFADACKNTIVDFTATDTTVNTGLSWFWNYGDGLTGSGNPTQHIYSAAGSYNVALYAVTKNGCVSSTIQKIINIYGTDANAGSDINAAEFQPVQLHGTGGISYQWSPPFGLNNPGIADPIAILSKDQTYYLTAFTPQGCSSVDTITIKVYKGPEIYVPNAFSPNNDDLNDVFKVIAVGIIEFKYFRIYNRWGQEVFETSDSNRGWDGTFNGRKQPPDVYVWTTSARDFLGNLIFRKGFVMLVR